MPTPALFRRLTLGDAVFIGLGSMLGAGVFAAFAPAARAAGGGLIIGLLIAAVVAFCNATSSAQLAAAYPSAGGTYLYGRERLGPWWGFAAGWSFLIGKTASCAAMAITFAAYAVPEALQRPVAALAVVLIAAVNYCGVTRTARLTRVLVVVVLIALSVVVVVGAASGLPAAPMLLDVASRPYGVLQSAALLFFAFAGYARIATMGEEVRDPSRTIPRAIVIALSAALIIYLLIAVVALGTLGASGLAGSSMPLADVVRVGGQEWAVPVVQVGAAAAALGALLSLVAGVGRTSLAMAREGDLPRVLAAVHPRFGTPHRAEVVIAVVVVVLVLTLDLRDAIGFSSFGVLLYYLVANAAAFTQSGGQRRYPRWAQVLGTVGCVVLVAALPLPSIVAGAVVLAIGLAGRLVLRSRRG